MIRIRSALSIRARGQWPHLEAVYMTAPRSLAEIPRKLLPRGGRPYMTCGGNGCDKNHLSGKSLKPCPAPLAKIFRLTCRANQPHNSARLTRLRDARDRHERAVRCDGRRWRARRTRRMRTAKSCGPDAAVLAPSSRKQGFAGDGGKKAVHQGEHEVSRKAIAQGRPGCSRWTCMLVCVFFARCTRDRGGNVPPVFPAPSQQEGGKFRA